MNKSQKIKIFIAIFIFIIVTIFLINKSIFIKSGNNSTNQEIVDYFLNISSYEVIVDVEVKSNKNSNKYILKQHYIDNGTSEQEVIEPANICGLKIIKEENNLKLENTNLSLSRVLENYNSLGDNILDLNCFIENYKNDDEAKYDEENDCLVLKTKSPNQGKYMQKKTLYIDKKNKTPTKMIITDINKNIEVYILYKEVKINDNSKTNILAFNWYNMKHEI